MSQTHPIPQVTGRTIVDFQTDIGRALKAFLPTNQRPYSNVVVILVSWDDAPEHSEEMDALQSVFEGIYRYAIVRVAIPASTGDRRATAEFVLRTAEVALKCDKGDLIVLYYVGHASHEYDKMKPGLNHPCIIHSNRMKVGNQFSSWPGSSLRSRTTRIDLGELVNATLNRATDADVLYILDCCYASSLAIDGRREILAACGFGRVTEGAGTDGSFTRILVEALEKANGAPMTVAQLHGYLTSSYYKNELSTTPLHVELSEELCNAGSIILSPLKDGSTFFPPHLELSQPFSLSLMDPKALISVTLCNSSIPPNANQWKTWLSTNLPSGIQEIDVKLEGFFKAKSAVMMVLVPVMVWTVLRGHDAYQFVSLVQSSNLLPQSLEGRMQQVSLGSSRPRNQQENIRPGSFK